MKQIVLNKKNNNCYSTEVSSSSPDNLSMETLAEWLTDDVHDFKFWRQWPHSNDPALDSVSSNASWLVKDEGKIIITSHYAGRGLEGYDEIPNKYTVLITPDNLIAILDTWQMMLQLRPNKIVITEENGIYKMFAMQ